MIGGNPEWMEAVEVYEPMVVVFGHDHETPFRKKIWRHALECGSLCINTGQDVTLRYSVLEFTFPSSEPQLPAQIKATAFPLEESYNFPLAQEASFETQAPPG